MATDDAADSRSKKSELLDLAEKAGIENLKARIGSAEVLAKEAGNTITIVLAGMGGSLAYAVKLFEPGFVASSVWGAAAVCAWLALISGSLVTRCLLVGEIMPVYNEPKNLYQPALRLTVIEVREYELENIQARITQTIALNWYIAKWLNRLRQAAAATPLIFSIAVVLAASL